MTSKNFTYLEEYSKQADSKSFKKSQDKHTKEKKVHKSHSKAYHNQILKISDKEEKILKEANA